MNNLELRTWASFVDVVKNFLGHCRAENYKKLVEKLLKSLQDIGANMNIKIYFILSHLDTFPNNCGDVNDRQGERFHHDIKTMEDKRIVADYCLRIKKMT